MAEPGGFADLRIGAQSHGSHSDASVWPSFTDIMTVVVMIFLMALVVILLRNAELVHELSTTTEAGQQSAQLAKATAVQKNELLARVDVLEARVVALLSIRARLLKDNEDLAKTRLALSGRLQRVEQARQKLATEKSGIEQQRSTLVVEKESLLAQLAALGLEKQQLARARAESEQRLSETAIQKAQLAQQLSETASEKITLAQQKAVLEADKQQLVNAKARIEQQLVAATQQTTALAAARQSLQTQVGTLGRELAKRLADSKQATAALMQQYAEQQRQLQLARKRVEAAERQLADLTENYSALEGKYERLVGPARSELGKTVVEVRYRKINGHNTVEMRPPAGGDFQPVLRAEMARRLTDLQARAPDKLYTRIIIPNASGLSYDEAWRFTNNVLQRYDYYHQPPP